MASRPLVLPGRHLINGTLMGANIAGLAGFVAMAPSAPLVAASFLGLNTVLSFIKGYTLTAAVGGADMRKSFLNPIARLTLRIKHGLAVVITVLNAYSGFALVAEGTGSTQPFVVQSLDATGLAVRIYAG